MYLLEKTGQEMGDIINEMSILSRTQNTELLIQRENNERITLIRHFLYQFVYNILFKFSICPTCADLGRLHCTYIYTYLLHIF